MNAAESKVREVEGLSELILKAKSRLDKFIYAFTATYAMIYEDGNIVCKIDRACHGDLDRGVSGCIAIVNKCNLTDTLTTSRPIEEKRAYLNWLVNESAYEGCFLENDVDVILREGYTVHRTDVPGNLLLQSLQAVRRLWEQIFTMVMWNKLVEAGFNKDYAFVLSSFCFAYWSKGEVYEVSFSLYDYDFSPFNPKSFSKKCLINYLNREMLDPNKNYECTGTYSDVYSLWGSSDEGFFRDIVDQIGAPKTNIFSKDHLDVDLRVQEDVEGTIDKFINASRDWWEDNIDYPNHRWIEAIQKLEKI